MFLQLVGEEESQFTTSLPSQRSFLHASLLHFASLLLCANFFSLIPLFSHTFFFFVFLCLGASLPPMTDITDDIAEEISFQDFDDDCNMLGSLLNDILQREAGPIFIDKLEKIRVLAQVFLFLPFHLLYKSILLFS